MKFKMPWQGAKIVAELDMENRKLKAAISKLQEALKEGIELVTSEYCSHKEPEHGMDNRCWAFKMIKALKESEDN